MGLDLVSAGNHVPDDINVVIEIPKDAEPVKYEVDKATGAIFVDRVLSTPMRYPCNYGYIPGTLSGDGDPIDALVLLPLPLIAGSVIRCRPVGLLNMDDEAGPDTKLIVVPGDKVFKGYTHIRDIDDAPRHWRDRIAHYGQRAIDGVQPWLADGPLAAFAIRVIWRVGEHGAPEEASRVLRAARGGLSPALQGDVDWALAALKQSRQVEPRKQVAAPASTQRPAPVVREAPLYSEGARRRSR